MRLPKRRVRAPAALVLVGALLLLASVVVVLGPDPEPPPGPPSDFAPTPVASPPARPAAPATRPPAPPRPARPAPAAGLTVVGARWRAAILENQRREVLALVAELRGQPTGRDDLLLLARDGEERVRAYALRELGRRREASLAPVFSASLEDPSPPVRENARWALEQLER